MVSIVYISLTQGGIAKDEADRHLVGWLDGSCCLSSFMGRQVVAAWQADFFAELSRGFCFTMEDLHSDRLSRVNSLETGSSQDRNSMLVRSI